MKARVNKCTSKDNDSKFLFVNSLFSFMSLRRNQYEKVGCFMAFKKMFSNQLAYKLQFYRFLLFYAAKSHIQVTRGDSFFPKQYI